LALDLRGEMGKTEAGGRDDVLSRKPMATVFRLSEYRGRPKAVFFSRPELNQLLSLYSRQVARGEWRDYAIDQQDGAALFSVFRHSHEGALYTILKTAPGTAPGDFVLLSGGHRLAASRVLGDVLARLQRKLEGRAVLLDSENCR
jgi:hypothetical protein